jgi:hypothetical protein
VVGGFLFRNTGRTIVTNDNDRAAPRGKSPVPLGSLQEIRTAARALAELPLKGGERLAVLRLLAALDEPDVGRELAALYPTLRAPRDRVKALAFAVELLPDEAKPRAFGEQVLLAMADGEG